MPRYAPDTFFGHPRALGTLFHIELWERFSFYGMQSILLIYLYYSLTSGGLGIDQGLAGGIAGVYGGSVYLATILGGWLADRVLGPERTLFYSGVVVMLGHVLLALIPGVPGLVVGLVCIALGSGGVKSSASSLLGSLYETEALRPLRDAGFSLFYLAINVGALFGPLLTGTAQTRINFHAGFGLAAIGMAVGLWRYTRSRHTVPDVGVPHPLSPAVRQQVLAGLILLLAIVAVLVGTGIVNTGNFSKVVLGINAVVVLSYFGWMLGSPGFSATEKRHVRAWIPLFLVCCMFWMLWGQVFTALVVYFDEVVPRVVYGFEVPVPWGASMQCIWMIFLSGAIASLWTRLGKRQPGTPMKFVLSMLVLAAAYYIFVLYTRAGEPMPLWMYALVTLIINISELLISPIALSFATKIAPASFRTQAVAVHFLSISLGFTAGGALFNAWYSKEGMADFYQILSTGSLLTGLALLLVVPVLNRMLKEVD